MNVVDERAHQAVLSRNAQKRDGGNMLRKKLAQAVLVYGALHGEMASAVGVGEIALASSLNQPFRAFIPVREAQGIEPDQLKVELASREAYANAGVDRTHFLTTLQFYVEVGPDGRGRIVVSTPQPVVEPYLDFIVEVRWPNGRMLREYTVLLDLPEFQADSAVSPAQQAGPLVNETAVSQAVRRESQATVSPAPSRAEPGGSRGAVVVDRPPSPTSAIKPRPDAQKTRLPASADGDKYRIQHHDTMWQVASRLRPGASVTIEQTMIALLRKNPDAFIGNNVNRVKSGYVLAVPTEEEVQRLSHAEAVREVKQQARDWRNNRSSARQSSAEAASKPASAPQLDATKSADNQKSESGGEASARFSIGSAGDSSSSEEVDALSKKLREEQELREKLQLENASIVSRVVEMEKQIDTLNKLIALKNRELAALQAGLTARNSNVQNAQGDQELSEEIQQIERDLAQNVAALEQRQSEKADLQAQAGDNPAAPGTVDPQQAADAIAMAKELAGEKPQASPKAGEVEVVADAAPVAVQEAPKGQAWYQSELVKYVGAGLAILGLLFVALRRRAAAGAENDRSDDPAIPQAAATAAPGGGDDSAFDDLDLDFNKEDTAEIATPEAEGDTEAEAFGTVSEFDFAALDESLDEDSGLDLSADDWEDKKSTGGKDGDEPVEAQTSDVISEAEIYVAYGRYDQAASLLKNAIVKDPKNTNLQVKLIDVYLDTRDKESFQETFELLQKSGDQDAIARVKESMSAIEGVSDWLSGDSAAPSSSTSLDALDDELSFLDDELSGSLDDAELVSSAEGDNVDHSEESSTAAADGELEGLGDELADFDLDLDIDLEDEVKDETASNSELASLGDGDMADFELDLDELDSEIASLDAAANDPATKPEEGDGKETAAGDELDEFTASLEEFSFDDVELNFDEATETIDTEDAEKVLAESDAGGLGDFELGDELSIDDLSLDDLSFDTETPESSGKPEAGEAVTTDEVALDDLSMDDLSFGEGSRADDAIGDTGAETEQVPTEAAADVADGLAELSLDIDEDIAELSEAGDLEDLSDLDSALAELDAEVGDFDFSEPVEPVEPAAEQPTSAEEKADQELDSLIDAADRDADSETNTDTITDDSTAPTTSDVAAIDLDDLVFDEFDASADDDDIGMLSDGDDVATKLDLARAYVELGDNDGAREMLEEVMQEGSEQQRDDAKALLEQLA